MNAGGDASSMMLGRNKEYAPQHGVSIATLLILLAVAATICGMLQPVLAPLVSPRRPASNNLQLPGREGNLSSLGEEAAEPAMIGVPINVGTVVGAALSVGILMLFAPLGSPWPASGPDSFLRDRLVGFLSGVVGGVLMLMPRSGLFQALTACCLGSLAIVALAGALARVEPRWAHRRAAAMLAVGTAAASSTPASGPPGLGSEKVSGTVSSHRYST